MDEILVIDDLKNVREENVEAIEDLLRLQKLEDCVKVASVDNELMDQLSNKELDWDDNKASPVEERFGQYLIKRKSVKLIVVDRDLHRYNSDIRSESTITEGASLAAVPVCGYSRRSRTANPGLKISRLAESVATPMIEVPKEPEKLAKYVVEIYHGNKTIADKISGIENTLDLPRRMSILLDKEDQSTYFANYHLTLPVRKGLLDLTDKKGSDFKLMQAYTMGLWLYKFILRFPGILLNKRVTATYLNLREEDFDEHSGLFEKFKYEGPFNLFSSYWWRYDLDDALLKQNLNDGVEYINIKKRVDIDVKPLDENGEEQVFCMVTEKTIPFTQSMKPRMVPYGADLARIERSTADQWQMYLP